MSRYNHHIIEKKWLQKWGEHPQTSLNSRVCTIYLPNDLATVDLENLRLLMLTDFFGYCLKGSKSQITWFGGEELREQVANTYGFQLCSASTERYDFALFPRDFSHLVPVISWNNHLFCGRFLDQTCLTELLSDFGLDALRLFFLSQGPPMRDYKLNWHNLVSSYRFVEKIWELGQNIESGNGQKQGNLLDLETTVAKRWQQKKPHTALAAIMGFMKGKNHLNPVEAQVLFSLLYPYSPFVITELGSLMATI